MSKVIEVGEERKFKVTESFFTTVLCGKVSGEIRIRFKGGDVWQYEGTTRADFDRFKAADSLGKFFSQEIKPKFKAVYIGNNKKKG